MLLFCNDEAEFVATYIRNNMGGDANRDIVRLIQISDLHAEEVPFRTSHQVEDAYSREFDIILRQWRSLFYGDRAEPVYDGLIISGDFVFAKNLCVPPGNNDELRSRFIRAHDFSHRCIERFRQRLSRSGEARTGRSVSCLLVPGNHDILLQDEAPSARPNANSRISSYHDRIHVPFCPSALTTGELFIRSPRVTFYEGSGGVIAVFGLDSNHGAYRDPGCRKHGMVSRAQLRQLKNAIGAVQKQFTNKPVYVVIALHHHLLPVRDIEAEAGDGVAGTSAATAMVSVLLDGPTVIKELQGMRVSLVLHGHMHEDFIVQNVSYFAEGEPQKLSIVGCPSFPQPDVVPPRADTGTPGGIVLTFDTVRGIVQVDAVVLVGDDKRNKSVAVPLISITRVSASENRIRTRMLQWLNSPQCSNPLFPEGMRPHANMASGYLPYADEVWEKLGYVQLWGAESTPLRIAGDEAELPTKRYRLLLILKKIDGDLYILLNNHVPTRDTPYGSWDTALLPAIRHVRDFFDRVRTDLIRVREDLMGTFKEITRRNDTLEAIEKALAELALQSDEDLEEEIVELDSAEFVKFSPTDGIPQRYLYSLCILPSLSLSDGVVGSQGIVSHSKPLQKLPSISGKACFRYEPNAASKQDKAPPGYIWFPLYSWRQSPSVEARNGDVMRWVERVIDGLKGKSGAVPSYLVLDGCNEISVHNYNFDKISPGKFTDLEEKLRGVTLAYNEGRFPYAKARIIQVCLKRSGQEGMIDVIQVRDGDGNVLGVLCPSQRYVLRQGLERAMQLQARLVNESPNYDPARLGTEEFGYLRTMRGDVELDILPPIIELARQVGDGMDEFLICDGNHRVAQYCWMNNPEGGVNAILINRPDVPYYIHQMRPEDWPAVVDNPMATTPDLASKYTVRTMTKDLMESFASEKVRSENRLPSSPRKYYRVLFRDFLAAGFKLGGQGGKLAPPK